MMSVDQRGFKTFIQTEAAAFLKPSQVMVNATVKKINHSASGATVTLADGSSLTADYVLSTFSLGVLHNDDVIFDPPLPSWKQEALHSMSMVRNLLISVLRVDSVVVSGNLHKDLPSVSTEVLV